MEQNNERIVQLIYRRLKGLPLNAEENIEVNEWLARSESNRRTYQNLSDESWLKEAKRKYYAPGKQAGLAQLREQLLEEAPVARTFSMKRLAFAASVLIVLTAGVYYLMTPTKQDLQIAVANVKNQLEITPGGKAILTLSNGLKIPFGEHANGLLAHLGEGKQLLKQDGKLVYQSAVAQFTAGGVDTTTDPRSDQYSVVLPDGSRAWLNRGTTLNYPETFATDKRIVELNGEAYFEIAQLAMTDGKGKLPFIVRMVADSLHPSEVEVLGTHFNIYAHAGEPIKTTLTEGKVKMSRGHDTQLLIPGQQAVLEGDSTKHIQLTDNISVEDVLAWKNYQFRFKDESIHSIMQEVARWYGNPLAIKPGVSGQFNLISDRNKPLSQVLDLLNQNGKARFSMNGNIIEVSP